MNVTFLKQLEAYKCKGIPIPLLSVSIPIEMLASIYNLFIQSWVEDGLGAQQGFIVELSNGITFASENYLQKPDIGVTFSTDSANVNPNNLQSLIELCVSIFSIKAHDILWQQTNESMRHA